MIDASDYSKYLLPNEKVELAAHLGPFQFFLPYTILATNLRLLIIKSFPKNLIELEYKDVEVVEYYTNVSWLKLIYSVFLFVVAYLFLINRDAILEKFALFLPPAEPIIYAGNFFGLTAGSFLIVAIFLVAGLYFFGLFIRSLFGRFRILIYEQAPLEIMTSLSGELQALMRHIEGKKRGAGR
ncbi:hypothetical protein HYS48_00985 [Candidatus Woesearchaeota archaeon]|nr:hypothetical protein [Candidatus Woesearchaeota archaeon]